MTDKINIKYPKNQRVWVTYSNEKQIPVYVVTSDISRSKYYLYKVNKDGGLTKLKTASMPLFEELEKF